MLKQTKEGFWVIQEDTHFGKWVEETQRLDHDRHVLNIIEPYLGCGIVLDIGANIGTHSYAYSKLINPKKVIAIEPNLECVECLKKNIPDCHILPIAISDKIEELSFNLDIKNIGASYVSQGKGTEAYPLDYLEEQIQFLTEEQKFSFIKIDIEGYELKALKGAHNLIIRNKPTMWIEVNQYALKRAGSSEEELLEYIKSLDYKFEEYPYRDVQYDILCKPL